MRRMVLVIVAASALVSGAPVAPTHSIAETAVVQPAAIVTHYRTVPVDGVNVFYREAGPADAPVVLLLHGFPTSSHMFRNLIPALADRYRVIAPDYPGFGESAAPITQSSPTPLLTMPMLWTACLASSAQSNTPCTSWIMALRSGTGSR